MSAKKKKNEKPTKPQLWLVRDTDPRAPFGGDVWIVWCVGIEAASEQPAAASALTGGDAVRELERWYFGCEFSQWKEKTEVGAWRDIVNEAGARIAKLRAERDAALVSLGQLQAERDADEKAYLEDIENLKIQTRCPDCGCATPEDAEASECGCDSPVCRITAPGTLATEFAGLHAERDALRAKLAQAMGVDRG